EAAVVAVEQPEVVGDPAGEALGHLGEVRPEDRPVLCGPFGHRPETGPLLEPVDGGGVGHRESSGGAGGAGGRGYCGPGGAESAPRSPSGENAPCPIPARPACACGWCVTA